MLVKLSAGTPGPASSEVEHSLRKIVFSGNPSLNSASSKKIFASKFLHKARPRFFKICHWNSEIKQSTIYWRRTVAIFPLSERIVYNN